MAIPLGIDVGRAAFLAMRKIMERVDAGGVVSDDADRVWYLCHAGTLNQNCEDSAMDESLEHILRQALTVPKQKVGIM